MPKANLVENRTQLRTTKATQKYTTKPNHKLEIARLIEKAHQRARQDTGLATAAQPRAGINGQNDGGNQAQASFGHPNQVLKGKE